LYERRQAIITGKAEPTDQDVETGKASDSDEEEEEEDDDEEEEGAKLTEVKDNKEDANITGIPEFWLTALKNAMPIAEQITDEDEEVRQGRCEDRRSH
jgi:nucleosome assembly protein 1-like 1